MLVNCQDCALRTNYVQIPVCHMKKVSFSSCPEEKHSPLWHAGIPTRATHKEELHFVITMYHS